MPRASLRTTRCQRGERWEILLRCAQVVDPYNATLGDLYFRRAVEMVEQLDDESAVLLEAHARTSHRIALDLTSEQRLLLAERLPRTLELHEPFVSESSILPREHTLKAVTRLDPASGFALCSRWDDEDAFGLWQGVPVVVREATELGFISPFEGLMLLRTTGDQRDVSSDAVALLEQLRVAGLVEAAQTSASC